MWRRRRRVVDDTLVHTCGQACGTRRSPCGRTRCLSGRHLLFTLTVRSGSPDVRRGCNTVKVPRTTTERITTLHPQPDIDVRRSARRRRTVAAYREGDRIVVLIPARFSRTDEALWVRRMVNDIERREQRHRERGPRRSDEALLTRARALNHRYLDGAADPTSVVWVDTMARRWASCTSVDRSIRVSARLRATPDWVLDYVLVHELAHILVTGHDADFWSLVNRYERTERARGYLEGVSFSADPPAGGTPLTDDEWGQPPAPAK